MKQNNPHLATRRIRDWLDLIPFDRARKEAIENYEKDTYQVNSLYYKMSRALWDAFYFDDSIQGYQYWMRVYGCLKRMESSVKLKTIC